MLNTRGLRFPIDVILVCIRWYAAYPLSYRHLEEMMQERGVVVDHATRNPDQDPASQIPQQYRGAGSPCRQTRHPADARLQVVSLCVSSPGRHRTHAHDSQRPVHDGRLRRHVVCRPILYVGRTSPSSIRGHMPQRHYSVFSSLTRQNRLRP